MTRALLVVSLLVGCTPAQRVHVNRIGLGMAVAGITCDWGQTRAGATDGWRTTNETNPIMGAEPSPRVVDVYMASMMIGTVVIGHLLPERYRPYFYGAVVTLQAWTITDNATTSLPHARTCGANF
jgi:hypothetical protein